MIIQNLKKHLHSDTLHAYRRIDTKEYAREKILKTRVTYIVVNREFIFYAK